MKIWRTLFEIKPDGSIKLDYCADYTEERAIKQWSDSGTTEWDRREDGINGWWKVEVVEEDDGTIR